MRLNLDRVAANLAISQLNDATKARDAAVERAVRAERELAELREQCIAEVKAQRTPIIAMNDGFGIAWNSAIDAAVRALSAGSAAGEPT